MTSTHYSDWHTGSLGLYVSIPFCRSKCTFCNFASGVYPASYHGRYVDRLCEELRQSHQQAEACGLTLPERVDSIYLGGGTPSVLEPALLRQLFAEIRRVFAVQPSAEITMECAPGQIADDVLEEMVACGVNRVSLGVQSFIDREAAVSGRLHNRATTLRDLDRLRAAGIHRLSLDLIAGLAHQTPESWRESLEGLAGTAVEHASIYMLEVDDDSRLGKEMLEGGPRYHAGAVPKDDTIAAMFEEAQNTLRDAGMQQYELSNFAVAGRESTHNLKYWQRDPYLGVGVDAHSMLLLKDPRDDGKAVRFGQGESLEDFVQDKVPWAPERLSRHAELEEALFLGLRLSRGVSLTELRQDFGSARVEDFISTIRELESDGLIQRYGENICLTDRGKLISNNVFEAILKVGDEQTCLS